MTGLRYILEGPGFFEIIFKGILTLKEVVFAVALIFICWLLYRFLGYILYFYFVKKLSHKDLDLYIDYLGNNFQYKHLGNGDKRYKWKKWFVVIKGNFDEDGKLVVNTPEPFDFFSYKSIVSFK
jgi:hypothetical protein